MSDAGEIQAHLKGALQRASRAGDADATNRVREEGHRLVFLLAGLVKAARVYSADNAALLTPSNEISLVLGSLIRTLGTLQIVLVDDHVYVNEIRLRVRPSEQPVMDGLIAELLRHGIGGLFFHEPLDAPQVRSVATILSSAPEGKSPRQSLAERLAATADIQVTGRWRFRIGGVGSTLRRELDEIIVDAIGVLSEAALNVGANRIISTLPIRRLVIDLVENLKNAPLAAAAVPLRFRSLRIAERHLVSTTGISILLGGELGLDAATLADLGIAAILHDVGYAKVPDRNRHAEAGARLLMRQRGFHEAKIRRLLAVLEHHRPVFVRDAQDELDSSPQSLFARIIHVANDYDVLVAPRPRQVPPLPPSQAVATLWGGRGRSYDPVLVALLARALGRYPPGTLLELTDWRWAVSVSGGRSRERFATPKVLVVRGPEGEALAPGQEMDLWDKRAHLQVRRVVDPALSGFDVTPALDEAFGD